jgi:hypothetical protein
MERIPHLNRFAAILVAPLAAAQAPAATSPTTSNAASVNTQAANAKVLSSLPPQAANTRVVAAAAKSSRVLSIRSFRSVMSASALWTRMQV